MHVLFDAIAQDFIIGEWLLLVVEDVEIVREKVYVKVVKVEEVVFIAFIIRVDVVADVDIEKESLLLK